MRPVCMHASEALSAATYHTYIFSQQRSNEILIDLQLGLELGLFKTSLGKRWAKKGHSEEQILRALRQAEGGTRVADVCREHGISEATYTTSGRRSTRGWG